MKAVFIVLVALPIAACGSDAFSATVQQATPCVAETNSLLALRELPADLALWNESAKPTLGLWNSGDSAFPGFGGRAERTFLWTGLYSSPARDLVDEAWAALHYAGTAPIGFIPSNGSLFTTYPNQLFRVSEASLDFASVTTAQKWLATQRTQNVPNGDPRSRNGIETNPAVARIGDDTFAYQISNGPSGDVYTDVQSRVGGVVYAIAIDGGPSFDGVSMSMALMIRLETKVRALCPSA